MAGKRVTKDQWLQGALDFIIEQGVFGMTPERLAKSLGTSRSSYYWHFGSQDEFRSQVVDYWAETYTGGIWEQLSATQGAPENRLDQLLQLVRENGVARYAGAVHALAYGSPALMEKIERADRIRFENVRSVFLESGVERDKLDAVTRIVVCYLTWRAEMGSCCGPPDSMFDDAEFLVSLLK